MAIKKEALLELLKSSLPDASITIDDFRGDEDHYSISVTSPSFKGKSRMEQHKLVNNALKEHLISGQLHALTIKTFCE